MHSSAKPVSAPSLASPPVGPLRLLIVEDDRTTGRLFSRTLKEAHTQLALQEPMQVEVVTRLADARSHLRTHPVDLLLLDGLLPDGTGIDFLRELRRDGCRTRIVFLSSFFRDLASYRALKSELGVAEVWHKPIAAPELIKRIQKVLGERRD